MAQWVGQQGSEAVSMGLTPSIYLHFSNFINTTENRNTHPSLMHQKFRYQLFLQPGRVPLRKIFGTVRQNVSDGKSRNRESPPFPLSPLWENLFETGNPPRHSRVPLRNVSEL